MPDFDGSTFVALDDDFIGDGSTDLTTKPISTYLENRLYGNQAYLRSRGRRTSFGFLTDATAPRRMSSDSAKTEYWRGWFQLGPSHQTLTVHLLGFVDDVTGTTIATMEATAQLLTTAGNTRQVVLENVTDFTEGSSGGDYRISLDVSEIVQDDRWYELRFWLRSDFKTGDVNDDTDVQINYSTEVDFVSSADDYTANIDSASSLQTTSGGGANGTILDPIAVNSASEVGIVGDGNLFTGIGLDVQRQDLSYVEPTGIMITETVDPDFSTVLWTTKDQSEMLPQRPVLGQHISRHGSNTDALFLQPRLIGMGPKGEKQPSGGNWPTDYHQRWPKSLGGGDYLANLSTRVVDTDSRIQIRGYLCGIHTTYYAPVWDESQLGDKTSTTNWDVTADIWQLTDGDTWSTTSAIDSETITLDGFRLYPGFYASPFPLLRQAYWAYTRNEAGSKLTYWDYTFKEGQLYAQDMPLIRPFTISLEVPDSVDTTLPVRIGLKAETFDTSSTIWRAGTTSEQSSNSALMMLIGYTAYEYPRL